MTTLDAGKWTCKFELYHGRGEGYGTVANNSISLEIIPAPKQKEKSDPNSAGILRISSVFNFLVIIGLIMGF